MILPNCQTIYDNDVTACKEDRIVSDSALYNSENGSLNVKHSINQPVRKSGSYKHFYNNDDKWPVFIELCWLTGSLAKKAWQKKSWRLYNKLLNYWFLYAVNALSINRPT
ncbi:hypothetical protein DYD21_16830 [Rhodohalobacter sp. SW132]|nr:hypothetical protein DYD21_16830 [Rhodohalobacter sp. SW132]